MIEWITIHKFSEGKLFVDFTMENAFMKKIFLITSLLFSLLSFSSVYAAIENTNMQAANNPPGLQGKGGEEFPRGLENKEKTPAGWSKGEKRGWNHAHKQHHHRVHNRDVDNDKDKDNDKD